MICWLLSKRFMMMKGVCEISWNWSSNAHTFSCDRVGEFQLEGVQRLSFHDHVIRVIEKISWQRVSDMLHMHTNLMGAPGFQVKFDERVGHLLRKGSFLAVCRGYLGKGLPVQGTIGS